MKRLAAIGAIESIQVSEDWFELPQQPDPFAEGWRRLFVLTGGSDVRMSFVYRGVDDAAAGAFRQIIESKPAHISDEPLTPFEVASVRSVLGSTAGDNQYTNDAKPGSTSGPTFEVVEARTRCVASHTVLYVRGSNRSGRHYAGIFYADGPDGRSIEEFMIHTGSKKLLQEHHGRFEAALTSIVWTRP